MAGVMLQTLKSHEASNFSFSATGDESCMFWEHHHETIWAASWKAVDELERPTHYHMKTMVTAVFSGNWESFMNISPCSWSMDTNCVDGEIIGQLGNVSYPEKKNPHEKKATLHFDNTPVHNRRTVTG
jgi:hypothetical protein